VGFLLTAVVGANTIGAYVDLREFLTSQMDGALTSTARQIMEAFEDRGGGEDTTEDLAAIAGYTGRSRTTRFRVWVDGETSDYAGSETPGGEGYAALRALPGSAPPLPDRERYFDLPDLGEGYRAVWLRRPTASGLANVIVASTTVHLRHEIEEIVRLRLISGAMILLLSVAAAAVIVWRGLRPVARTAEALRGVTLRNLGPEAVERFPAPAELRPLVEAVRTMLARLEESVSRERRFTADASHELRTPIATAKSILQTIRLRPRQSEDYCRAIDDALAELDRLRRRTEQLLLLARLDEAGALTEAAPVELDRVVVDVAAHFAALAEAQGSRLLCADLLPVRVRGSRELLEQLLGNLVDNALRHGPEKGTVTLALSRAGNGRAAITVHDEGGAIPPEALAQLTDRFFRLDSSRSRSTGGSGLGLSIAREIALHHGGSLLVSSDPASGTVCRVELPLDREEPGP
jgi:signal transduction histidine kinase